MRDGGSHFVADKADFANKQHLSVPVDGLKCIQAAIDVVDTDLWPVPRKGFVCRTALGSNQLAEHLPFAVDFYRRATDDLRVMIATQQLWIMQQMLSQLRRFDQVDYFFVHDGLRVIGATSRRFGHDGLYSNSCGYFSLSGA